MNILKTSITGLMRDYETKTEFHYYYCKYKNLSIIVYIYFLNFHIQYTCICYLNQIAITVQNEIISY